MRELNIYSMCSRVKKKNLKRHIVVKKKELEGLKENINSVEQREGPLMYNYT